MPETKEKTLNDTAPDIGALLDKMRAERADLDGAIRALEKYAGAAPSGSVPIAPRRGLSGESQTIAHDEFLGMTVVDAAVKYLGIVKKPQSIKEIAAGLDKGGLIHQTSKFETTVYAMVSRAAARGDRVRKFHKNWGLISWGGAPTRPVNKTVAKRKAKRTKTARTVKPKLTMAGNGDAKPAEASSTPQQMAS